MMDFCTYQWSDKMTLIVSIFAINTLMLFVMTRVIHQYNRELIDELNKLKDDKCKM